MSVQAFATEVATCEQCERAGIFFPSHFTHPQTLPPQLASMHEIVWVRDHSTAIAEMRVGCQKCARTRRVAPLLAMVAVIDNGCRHVLLPSRVPSRVAASAGGQTDGPRSKRTTWMGPVGGKTVEMACRKCTAKPRARRAALVREAEAAHVAGRDTIYA